jgi:5'-phosphate synthase pdxT subunit
VLALQGDFIEHIHVLQRMGVDVQEVRKLEQLEGLDGLIIPGGESTAIVKLMDIYGWREGLRKAIDDGLAVWGTCAGMIVIARELADPYPRPLGLLDIKVARNWFGRQVDSFEEELDFTGLTGGRFRAVFIRAPVVKSVGRGVEVLARVSGGPAVAVRKGRLMATAFHPELTADDRVHRYFVRMATGEEAVREPARLKKKAGVRP